MQRGTGHREPVGPQLLTALSYNIHKGYSTSGRRYVLTDMRDALRHTEADVVLLQEVFGAPDSRSAHADRGASPSQHEYLAGTYWPHVVYGQNAVYPDGHHGNAILSKHPIVSWENIDISSHPFESRGLLHVIIQPEQWPRPLHLICLHLALLEFGRMRQIEWIGSRVASHVPAEDPLLIAGDFNDWRHRGGLLLEHALGVHEAHKMKHGRYARTFPSLLPILHLDRMYVRGLEVTQAAALGGAPWSSLSDHSPLMSSLTPVSPASRVPKQESVP